MDAIGTLDARERINITEQGRLDLACAASCDCNPRLAGILIQCPECGTVYGTQTDLSLPAKDRVRTYRYARK